MSVVDLTHTLHEDIPTFGDERCCSFNTVANLSADGFFNRELHMFEHVGTHIDAPSHFDPKGKHVDEIDCEKLVGPLVVICVEGPCKIDDTYQISEYDVLKHEKLTSRKIGKGSIVCFFSGWSKKWLDPYRYKNGMRFPGLSESCMALLISRGVVGVGIDTLSVDVGTSSTFPVHHLGLKNGIFFLENVANLDKVLDGHYQCVVGAIKVKGGSGGPCRILAIKSAL